MYVGGRNSNIFRKKIWGLYGGLSKGFQMV
jgi:hypothetical protein